VEYVRSKITIYASVVKISFSKDIISVLDLLGYHAPQLLCAEVTILERPVQTRKIDGIYT
jgi:hypothetical protein